MDLVAQLQPNNKAKFVALDMADALAARASYRSRLNRMRGVLAG
jgi:allophanate hydrolase subunit 2